VHRIVVVGGGAGGLPLASALGDRYRLSRRALRAEVTLVDPFPTHVWKPLLHEVAAGRMDADAHGVDYPAVAHRHGFRFRQGAMTALDRAARTVRVAGGRRSRGWRRVARAHDRLTTRSSFASAASRTTSACRASRRTR
jgi:NADH dehydrogenase